MESVVSVAKVIVAVNRHAVAQPKNSDFFIFNLP